MNYVFAVMLLLCSCYLLLRVAQAFVTGILVYKPRYQPERRIRYSESRREFCVVILIFIFAAAGGLWSAWSILHLSQR